MMRRDAAQLDFLELCQLGDEQGVRKALATGLVDAQYRHPINGWTALHWAACRGHEPICVLLLNSGYTRQTLDNSGRTAYDVCPVRHSTTLEILRPVSAGGDFDNPSSPSPANSVENAMVETSSSTDGFVPNYIRNPPFPFTSRSSFDNVHVPASPTGGESSPTYYSYGRRDSLNKTKFLLLRTSHGQGKETYKRITLPGASTVERLRLTIEKACQGKKVEAIYTLPDNVLVEEEDQIQAFINCQKIDVIFGEKPATTTETTSGKEPGFQKATTDEMSKRRANSITVAEETGEAEVEIPYNAEQADERFQAEREDENRPLTPAEDLTPYTTTKEPSPPVSLAATDLDSNGDSAPEMLNDSASLLDEPKLIPLTTRDSLDSDHGDFEKVYNDEAAPAIAGIAAAIPHIAEAKSELPRAPSPASMLLPPSSKATVVEESKQRPHDESSSDIASWINNNPTLVRNVATVAAVAGVAGLGYYVYTRKMK